MALKPEWVVPTHVRQLATHKLPSLLSDGNSTADQHAALRELSTRTDPKGIDVCKNVFLRFPNVLVKAPYDVLLAFARHPDWEVFNALFEFLRKHPRANTPALFHRLTEIPLDAHAPPNNVMCATQHLMFRLGTRPETLPDLVRLLQSPFHDTKTQAFYGLSTQVRHLSKSEHANHPLVKLATRVFEQYPDWREHGEFVESLPVIHHVLTEGFKHPNAKSFRTAGGIALFLRQARALHGTELAKVA